MSDSFDKLPKRPQQHKTESRAVNALRLQLSDQLFLEQSCSDEKDYGTDIHIEAMTSDSATNIRIHTQVKGTESNLNNDGSLSISDIDIANVNYLFRQPHSLYIGYHVPSGQLFFKVVEDLIRDLEHTNPAWRQQDTITVRFRDLFTPEAQTCFHKRVIASAKIRDQDRLNLLNTPPEHLLRVMEEYVPNIDVPNDKQLALTYLRELYDKGHDAIISKAHNQFSAILDSGDIQEFGLVYLAEINLAVCHRPYSNDIIRQAIPVLESNNTNPKINLAGNYYNLGNAYLGLKDYPKARRNFIISLRKFGERKAFKAQCHKNLGGCYQEMGRPKKAFRHYQQAIALSPQLVEAHFSLGMWHLRENNFAEALDHLDRVTISDNKHVKTATLQGWRADVLFNLGEYRSAFREVNALLLEADKEQWIWPWCYQLILKHRSEDTYYYQYALTFWEKFIECFPSRFQGHYYKILTIFRLKQLGVSNQYTFDSFKELITVYASEHMENVSFLWDRAGHWAQYDGDWLNALKCYQKAYEKEPSKYGYCLAVSLINTEKYQEAIDILENPSLDHEIDGLYFNQLASAKIQIGDLEGAIGNYRQSIEIESDYHLPWFELAGCYCNARQYPEAKHYFEYAITNFPNETEYVDRANMALEFIASMGY
ncbi:tetratricopeptide repeat protein [Rheinheimera sp. A13L]|uniref:tetratricopeptide repeat protein n=1 Tax=Rheinheimera sp. A13L TaxID=506534 RepID=UPI00021252E4|nr:tetratricopeptide repeat protein [Rheinheimera sp. A13L]EGM78773.1 tetratricopeptide repeat protein [Rheinheimera sp. A13L]